MCGLFCFFGGSETTPREAIDTQKVFQALEKRGPDGTGLFETDGLLFAHSRLSIIDVQERSNQPFIGERWVLAYNGEIVNYRSLRQDLSKEGAVFFTESDTEVLYRAIDLWGPQKAVSRLCGMFAFAAFDRIKRTLWLARDPLGIKPLFLVRRGGYVACASWPSALLNGLKERWKLDQAGLASFFQFGAPQGGLTFVEEISSLPCGELWEIGENLQITSHTYWRPAKEQSEFRPDLLEGLLEEVVHEHLIADVPVALLLSGGVDSTALGCFLPSGSRAFHLDSPEKDYAQEVSDHFGFALHIEDSERIDDWSSWLYEFSASSGGAFSSANMPLLMTKAMASTGVKVGLSANGADELFLGYPRTPAPDLSPSTAAALPVYDKPPAKSFADQVDHIFGSAGNFLGSSATQEDADLANRRMIAKREEQLARATEQVGERGAYRLFELRTYVEQDLNPTLDHTSMHNSLEMRVPFLDHRIVSYVLGGSSNDLIWPDLGRKAPLKWLLRKRGLHTRVWQRAKIGFSLPAASRTRAREAGLQTMSILIKDGYMRFFPRTGNFGRDFQRALAAAVAFAAWKRAWVDTGIVSR